MKLQFFHNMIARSIAFCVMVLSTATLSILSYYYTVGQANLVEGALIQSNIQVVEQTVARIEQKIIDNDATLASIVDVEDKATQAASAEAIQGMDLNIDSVWFLKPSGEILYPSYSNAIRNAYAAVRKHFSDPALRLDQLPLNQIRHLHKERRDNYFFASFTVKENLAGERIVVSFLIGFDKSIQFMNKYLQDLGQKQYARIIDSENSGVVGDLPTSGKYIVQSRFPTTFYKWTLQMVPRNFAELERVAKQQRRSVFFLINFNIIVILLSLGFIYVAARRERQLVQLKEDFISNVSHELKTPLSMIRMFSEILVLGKFKNEDARQDYYRIIHTESCRMGRLIANLLDFASLEREPRLQNPERVCVGELITRVLEGYQHNIQQEGFELTANIEENIPEVIADPNALTMAFLNLLDNSVKYSTTVKQIIVSVRRNDGFVDLAVTDLGLGIPKQEQKRIFEKFYRGTSAAAQRIRGSGIGLSIAKRVAEIHGGSVLVESEPGKGSVFTLRIPISQASG